MRERERLKRFLEGLRRDEYLVVVLFFVEELSVDEIKQITGKSDDEIERIVNDTIAKAERCYGKEVNGSITVV